MEQWKMKTPEKVEPKYMKTARRVARAAWNALKTKKCRDITTKCVMKSFKEYERRIQSEINGLTAVLKSGYGTTSPQFKCAMKKFNDLIKGLERGYATGNAWLELVNSDKEG